MSSIYSKKDKNFFARSADIPAGRAGGAHCTDTVAAAGGERATDCMPEWGRRYTALRTDDRPGRFLCSGHAFTPDTLRLIRSSSITRLTHSRIWPIPAMPEMAASIPGESAIPSTWATPRAASITAVRFSPAW